MSGIEAALKELVAVEVAKQIAALGGFKRPAEFRIDAGLSVAQAAQISGVSAGAIRRYESGDWRHERGLGEKAVLLSVAYRCSNKSLLESIRKQHQITRGK